MSFGDFQLLKIQKFKILNTYENPTILDFTTNWEKIPYLGHVQLKQMTFFIKQKRQVKIARLCKPG